jgi:hypothetical protein
MEKVAFEGSAVTGPMEQPVTASRAGARSIDKFRKSKRCMVKP